MALCLFLLLGSSAAPARGAEPVRILFLGDSITAGYGLSLDQAYPARLGELLEGRGWAVTILNGGLSGDTSAGGRDRLEWALGDRPDAVVVALGGNDVLRGIDPAATRANLAAILAMLRERGLPVLLAGMRAPTNLGSGYVRAFDAIYPALAREYGALLYPFLLEGVAADPALNQADGIHPTPQGQAIIARNMLPLMERLLKRAGARRAR